MAYFCSEEEERLQNKLIPLNIAVCILCLIAIISLLVTPLIKVDVGKMDTTVITDMFGSGDSDSSESSFGEMFENAEGEISVTPIDLGKIVFAGNDAFETFIDTLFVKSGIADSLIVPMAEQTLLQQFDLVVQEDDLSDLDAKFRALGNVHTPEAMRAAAADFIDAINALAPDTVGDDEMSTVIDTFEEMYNDTIVATGGEYDLEKLLCVFVSDFLDLSEPVTGYTDLFIGIVDKGGALSNLIKNTTGFDIDMAVKIIVMIPFGIAMFTAFVWFVMFLFALFHSFAQNKRFTMWYVKLFGALPCVIFGILPLAGAGIFKLLGGTFAKIAALLGCISTLTWINGGCYLLLWIFSIFWAFPIKRKIRADRKN